MEIDGSLIAAGVAGVTGIVTVVAGYGKQTSRINTLAKVVDKMSEEFAMHEKDYADRMARLEVIAENQNTFHQKMDEKMDRILEQR